MTHQVRPATAVGDNESNQTANVAAWQGVLDTLQRNVADGESYLEAARKAAEQGKSLEPPPLEFQPPENLGPLPTELADWAKDLLHRQERLGQLLGQNAQNIRAQHDSLTTPQKPATSVALYLDTSL